MKSYASFALPKRQKIKNLEVTKMQKVVYLVSKVNKDKKLKGVGYLVEGNLLIPSTSSKGNPYIRVFEDVTKHCHQDVTKKDEYKGYVTVAYPHAEYFIKIGLQHLATNKVLLKKTAKDKAFRKWLIRNAKLLRNEYGTSPYFSAQVILSSYKKQLSLIEGLALNRALKTLMNDYNYTHTLSKIIPKRETPFLLEYIQKQNTNLSSYTDYIKACEYLELDMSLPKNRFPHDFKRWHDIRIDQYHTAKALKDAEERKELYAQFAVVAEKYLPLQRDQDETFIVVIARSPQDLIREGEALSHCVGRMNYDQKFAREESLIFFVRDKNRPNVPFVTLEYSLSRKKILQCYGEHDNRPSESVMAFVKKKWLPYANRKLKQIAA